MRNDSNKGPNSKYRILSSWLASNCIRLWDPLLCQSSFLPWSSTGERRFAHILFTYSVSVGIVFKLVFATAIYQAVCHMNLLGLTSLNLSSVLLPPLWRICWTLVFIHLSFHPSFLRCVSSLYFVSFLFFVLCSPLLLHAIAHLVCQQLLQSSVFDTVILSSMSSSALVLFLFRATTVSVGTQVILAIDNAVSDYVPIFSSFSNCLSLNLGLPVPNSIWLYDASKGCLSSFNSWGAT